MSSLIIVSAAMHKITSFDVYVRYRQPGNVVGYSCISFDIYTRASKFYAIPLTTDATKRLTNLPDEFSFRIEDDAIYISAPGLEEVVEDIVNKLHNLGFIKMLQNNYAEKKRVYVAEQLEFC